MVAEPVILPRQLNRTSFSHPMIIGFAAVWVAITGVYLFFRTN